MDFRARAVPVLSEPMRLLPRPFAGTVGLVGAVAAGWGLYHLMLIGSCSTPPSDGLPPCPPGSEVYFFAVFGGLFSAVPAIIFGGGAPVFLGVFTSIGIAGVMAGLSNEGGDDRRWLVAFGACFLLTPVLGIVALPVRLAARRRAERLLAEGAEAIGTVLAVDDTGVTINNNPRVRLRFRIEPVDGFPAPYEATKVATVSRLALPRPGDRYPVWFDRSDPQRWAFATSIEPEAAPGVRRLWDLAKRATRPTVPPPALPAAPAGNVVSELGRLNEMRLSGAISDADFAQQTAALLDRLNR